MPQAKIGWRFDRKPAERRGPMSSTISNSADSPQSVLDLLVDRVESTAVEGTYNADTQSWTHRAQAAMSPQKHHQEM